MNTTHDIDVLVCGGGPAGVCAAVSAAREGARVVLAERFGCLGGNLTLGHVSPILGKVAPGTMADEIRRLLPDNDHTPLIPFSTYGFRPGLSLSALSMALAVVVALAESPAAAREITSGEAERAAAAWARRAAAEVSTVSKDSEPLFHVVHMVGGGAVVTSAESGIAPVVAFLDGDVPDEANPLWQILRADMAERTARVAATRAAEAAVTEKTSSTGLAGFTRFAHAASTGNPDNPVNPVQNIFAAEAAWEALLAEGEKPAAKSGARLAAAGIPDASGLSDLRVAPLLATSWYQEGNAANYYTPPYAVGNPDNYPCGCVALVGAEIANFWQFPTTARPPVTNLCWVGGVAANYVSMGGTYDWANMPTDFSSLTDDQKRAVGRLCYDFGVATQMEWGPRESGTAGSLLGVAFRDVFGFAGAVAYSHDGDVMTSDLVERAILANLDAKCPVAVGLYGHEAVADGYGYASGALYTHINLGWGGAGNVWYNLPEVEVDESGILYSSSILDTVVFNIHPTASGELLTGRVLDENGDPVAGATVTAFGGGATLSGTTDACGIYALRVEGGRTWMVVATDGNLSGSSLVAVGSSSSAVCIRQQGWVQISDCGAVGNSWGNDITLGAAGTSPILFVDAAGGSDANNGLSWATAKASIQAAIDIVEGNADTNAVILVNDGRYEPIVATNDIPFSICSVNGPDATVIDGSLQWARGVTNRCATLGSVAAYLGLAVVHTNTVLSGFTLTNGSTPTNGTTAVVSGGGSCHGILRRCVLAGNAAQYGGGAYRGILEECVLTNNTATISGGAAYFVTLENCIVADNSANKGGGLYNGSANLCTISGNNSSISGGGAAYTELMRCTITNNTTGTYGGGAQGGTLNFCTVIGNTAQDGGGTYGATLDNCIVINNFASGSGGGAYNGKLTHCTVFANSAHYAGGVFLASLANCIVWGNAAETFRDVCVYQSRPCYYSCVGEVVYGDIHIGNFVANPLFVDAAHGDFHLQANSPCINAGTNEYATTETDFYGGTRFVGRRVDMGASEFQQTSGYAAWAAENGLGAADAVTDGQPNLIRYVFDRPSGVFSPFTDFDCVDGKLVFSLLPCKNTGGLTIAVISSTNLADWSNAEEFPFQAGSSLPLLVGGIRFTFHHADEAPQRFYRLKVEE